MMSREQAELLVQGVWKLVDALDRIADTLEEREDENDSQQM
jgi:hypothetical protein